jgi:hypothetical protein
MRLVSDKFGRFVADVGQTTLLREIYGPSQRGVPTKEEEEALE